MTRQAISNRLKAMDIELKQRNWVLYELKWRDIECHFFNCVQLLQKQRADAFFTSNSDGKRKMDSLRQLIAQNNCGVSPAMHKLQQPNQIFREKLLLSIWWVVLGGCIMTYSSLTKPSMWNAQLIQLSRALKLKCIQYAKRHDKVICSTYNARPHFGRIVKEKLCSSLDGKFYPTRCILQTFFLLATSCSGWLLIVWSSSSSRLTKKPKIKLIIGSLQKTRIFFSAISCL